MDYEYIPLDDGGLNVVCGVARNLQTNELRRRRRDEMGAAPFFDCGPEGVLVAFNAQAEMEAHRAMGWPLPVNVICLYAEHMLDTNGADVSEDVQGRGGSLLAAMKCNGLPARHAGEKKSIVERILAGPPYSSDEWLVFLDYCQQDTDDAAALFRVLWNRQSARNPFYLSQALLRGEYAKAMADMTRTGCPVNVALHDLIFAEWPRLRRALIDSVAHYGLYDEQGTFKHERFARIVESLGAGDLWPRTPGGQFSLKTNDFRRMTGIYPQMEDFRAVHEAVAQTSKISPLPLCSDGRMRLGRREQGNRRLGLDHGNTVSVGFGAYRAKTGRNQPRAGEFLPAAASWWRTLVTPEPGKVIGYFDYKSEEFGVAAYKSQDPPMLADYATKEVYIPLGIRSGLIPPGATKKTHGEFRDKVLKPVQLGMLYGREPPGIALAIGGGNPETYRQDLLLAKRIHGQHKRTSHVFWTWIAAITQEAYLTGRIETDFGWRMLVGDPLTRVREGNRWQEYGTKSRTLLNWLMQATAGDIIRVACAALTAAGVEVIFPVHDAILFMADIADKEATGDLVAAIMERAATVVVGMPLDVDRQWVLPGENWRPAKGDKMWRVVAEALAGHPALEGVR